MSDIFFETDRLIARRFGARDLEPFVAMRADPEIARYQDWDAFTQAQGREFLAWLAPRSPGSVGWFQFALEERESAHFIGDCGLKIAETDSRLAQIGYTVARQYWRKGYASEAVRGLIQYAMATFPIHRISASVDPLNEASVRVLKKAGLRKEAYFRQSEWFKGRWADDAIYAMLREEWRGKVN